MRSKKIVLKQVRAKACKTSERLKQLKRHTKTEDPSPGSRRSHQRQLNMKAELEAAKKAAEEAKLQAQKDREELEELKKLKWQSSKMMKKLMAEMNQNK